MGDFSDVDFSLDFDVAPPVIPATDSVNYIFSFSSAAAAAQDTVVGTYAANEVTVYFGFGSSAPPPNAVEPLAGYQPMISQPGPIIDALYDHPNLILAMDLALPFNGESAVLRTTFTNAQLAVMQLVLANYGTIITAGFYPLP